MCVILNAGSFRDPDLWGRVPVPPESLAISKFLLVRKVPGVLPLSTVL